MRQFAFAFIGSFIRATAFSAVMMLITLTLVTGHFPPRLSDVTQSLEGLRQMQHLQPKSNPESSPDENDVQALAELNTRRSQIAGKLFGGRSVSSVAGSSESNGGSEAANEKASSVQIRALEQRIWHLESELEDLKARLPKEASH